MEPPRALEVLRVKDDVYEPLELTSSSIQMSQGGKGCLQRNTLKSVVALLRLSRFQVG